MKTIIEPFKIKSVEPIRFTTAGEREKFIERAGYNLFLVPAEDVLIDLLTDSGTSAMSAEQWAGIMRGDESYAGARSFYRFEEKVQRADGLRAHHPDAPGTRGRENPLLARRRQPGRWSRTMRISTPRGPTSNSPARKPSIFRRPRAGTPTSSPISRGTWTPPPSRSSSGRARRGNHPAVHDHRDEQLRRRPAGLDEEHPRNEGDLRDSTGSRSFSTPAGSRRTPTSSSCASRDTAASPCGRSPGRCSRTPTGRR